MHVSTCKLPYSGKLSKVKNFVNFEVSGLSMKVFSAKIDDHTLIIGGAKQSTKVFSANFLLRQSFLSRKFPAIRYTVVTQSEQMVHVHVHV